MKIILISKSRSDFEKVAALSELLTEFRLSHWSMRNSGLLRAPQENAYQFKPYSVQFCNGFSGNRRDGRAVDFDRRSRSDILFKGYIKLLKGTEGKGMRHALSVDRAP